MSEELTVNWLKDGEPPKYTAGKSSLEPSITFHPESKLVMKITRDGIWVDPEVEPTITASQVLNVMDGYIKTLVAKEQEEIARLQSRVKDLEFACHGLEAASKGYQQKLVACERERNAWLAKELEAVATWSADAIHRYIHQLTDDQFCTKCVRGQCTGDKEGVCCGN